MGLKSNGQSHLYTWGGNCSSICLGSVQLGFKTYYTKSNSILPFPLQFKSLYNRGFASLNDTSYNDRNGKNVRNEHTPCLGTPLCINPNPQPWQPWLVNKCNINTALTAVVYSPLGSSHTTPQAQTKKKQKKNTQGSFFKITSFFYH